MFPVRELKQLFRDLVLYVLCDNNFAGYVPIPGKENPLIALEEYLREPKPEIIVYYNTDEEYFTFNRLQDEPMADTSMAEDTYIFDRVTFYIFKD